MRNKRKEKEKDKKIKNEKALAILFLSFNFIVSSGLQFCFCFYCDRRKDSSHRGYSLNSVQQHTTLLGLLFFVHFCSLYLHPLCSFFLSKFREPTSIFNHFFHLYFTVISKIYIIVSKSQNKLHLSYL